LSGVDELNVDWISIAFALPFASNLGHSSRCAFESTYDSCCHSKTCVSGQTTIGDTALIVAARNGKSDMVKLLIEHGANVDFQVRNVGSFYSKCSDIAVKLQLSVAALILLV